MTGVHLSTQFVLKKLLGISNPETQRTTSAEHKPSQAFRVYHGSPGGELCRITYLRMFGYFGLFVTLGVWFIGTRLFNGEYGYLQTLILAFTLVAVVIYTIDTRRMQGSMVKQTNLAILPVFVVHLGAKRIERNNRSFHVMELENLGKGVALNVVVDTINIVFNNPEVEGVWPNSRIIFNPIMAIKPSERLTLEHLSIFGPAGEAPAGGRYDFMQDVSSRAERDYELKVRFLMYQDTGTFRQSMSESAGIRRVQ